MSKFCLMNKAHLPTAVSAALLIVAGSSQVIAQNTLEEIVVTAQKRDQSLQDVPISVAAFDAEMLDNMVATDIADIAAFTPNVSISTSQATQPSLSIRGIGTSDFGVGLEPAVGVYIDGVYIGRSGAANLAFNDMQRVEILNGPQGTLFGRNAAAGAVQYITNKPNQETEGWMKLTLGNYGKTQLEGVYNTPLTDKLALRVSGLVNQRDGYIEDTGDDRNDEDNRGVVASLLWTPSDRLEVLWRVEYDEIDQTSRADSSATLGPRDNGADFEKIENDGDTREWRDLFGTSLHVTYGLGDVAFTSITSYRTFESFNRRDKDGSAEARYFFDDLNYEDNAAFSQEWRFESTGAGPLQWVAGANYFRENAEQVGGAFFSPKSADKFIWDLEIAPLVDDNFGLYLPYDEAVLGGTVVPQFLADAGGLDSTTLYPGAGLDFFMNSALSPFADVPRPATTGRELIANVDEWLDAFQIDGDYTSYAVYGDLSYDLNDSWTVTGGLRWTQDEKEFGRLIEYNEFGLPLAFPEETRVDANGNYDPGGTVDWYTQKDKWDELTGRFVVDFNVNDDVLLYGSWSTGYKSGGFNSAGAVIDEGPLEAEDVENIEFGIKSTFFDNTLRINAAVFDFDYKNLQKLVSIAAECRPDSNVSTFAFVGDDIKGDGYELAVTWLASDGLTLGASTGKVDASLTRSERQEVVNGQCVTRDRAGEDFSNPPSNYNLFANYDMPLNSGAEMRFSISYSFSEGGSRSSCTYQSPEGNLYKYSTNPDTGAFEVTQQSRTGPALAAPTFASCPNSPDSKQASARLTYLAAGGDWEVALYAKNLFTEDPVGDPGGLGGDLRTRYFDGSPTYGNPREPVFYGAEVRYAF